MKRQATFLTLIGPTMYQQVTDLVAQAEPNEKILEQLVDVLIKHYNPKPVEIMQWYDSIPEANKLASQTISQYWVM